MTPLKQRNRHRPEDGVWGDCHRACVASMLDLPLDAVPHFGDGGCDNVEFDRRVREYLASQRIAPVTTIFSGSESPLADVLDCVGHLNPGMHYIIGGKSRAGCGHSVIGFDRKIVFDPSLDENGIVGPMDDGFYWITFLGRHEGAAQ